jgi:hypothetical protein
MTRDVRRLVGKYVVKVEVEGSKLAVQDTSLNVSESEIETEKWAGLI